MKKCSTEFSYDCDVAIIGSGIAGATLGAILAKQGLSVIIFEAGEHPRFAIGESMILETSESMRALAKYFDIPEIGYFASINAMTKIGTSHGVKRHFGFMAHESGAQPTKSNCLQAVIPDAPYGHELHLFRQDSDYFMANAAIRYGAVLQQRTRVTGIGFSDKYAKIQTESGTIISKMVVDGSGFGSQARALSRAGAAGLRNL